MRRLPPVARSQMLDGVHRRRGVKNGSYRCTSRPRPRCAGARCRYLRLAGYGPDPQMRWVAIRDAAPGNVFWTPRHGGHWIATRAHEIETMQKDDGSTFSHEITSLPRETAFPLYPLTLDPPRHRHFRRLILPNFMPRGRGARGKGAAARNRRDRGVSAEGKVRVRRGVCGGATHRGIPRNGGVSRMRTRRCCQSNANSSLHDGVQSLMFAG
jgi:hypothetical protein